MRPFETGQSRTAPSGAWAHAGEVAQWALMLLGWLWLGEQGMRLGWSLASGVLAVSLWWAARLLSRGSRWALSASPAVTGWCGALCALGVWLPEALRRMDADAFNLPHLGLLALALLWGAWCGLVETRSRVSTFEAGSVAWHPVLAAWCVGLIWWGSLDALWATGCVSVLLALCAWVLFVRDRATTDALALCRGQRSSWSQLLAPSAMGLMMGSLWLGNVWCAGLGWTTQEMVLGHLAMMAALPTLVALAGCLLMSAGRVGADEASPVTGAQTRFVATLTLLALGPLMLLGQSPLHGFLAMLLPSLAWALHCSRPRIAVDFSGATPPGLMRSLALILGPGLLIGAGLASPAHGPEAMQTALALLGSLAGMLALLWCARPAVAKPSWSAP